MKRILFSLITTCAALSPSCMAQTGIHPSLGFTWPLDFRSGSYRHSAIGFYIAADKAINEQVQIGAKLQTEGFGTQVTEQADRIYAPGTLKLLDLSPTDRIKYNVPARSFVATLTGAYVWHRNARFSPRIGAAIGVSHDSPEDKLFASSSTWHPTFAPEVGVTYRRHWDINFAYRITKSTYSHATLSIGYRF